MNIKCGQCGGRHESVAKVRECWEGKAQRDWRPNPAPRLDSYERAAAISAPRMGAPTATATREAKVTKDGMYRNPKNGDIFKVQKAVHGSGHLYAKRLVIERDATRGTDGAILEPASVRFDYAPGVIYRLSPEWRMTIEEARKFGALYGTCVRCGRTLTREDSIERMMGPVCAGKENWA